MGMNGLHSIEDKQIYVTHVDMRRYNNIYYQFVRNVFNMMASVIALFITLPLIVIVSFFIILESPGSPFYIQERLGINGKKFKIIKLRSMHMDAEKNGAKWAERNDPRITKVGNFIRKTRIDELPQFLNVLKGDMVIIGPRPERPNFTEQFEKEIPGFKKRLLVKPGITGLAQVNGGYNITPKEKWELDIYYINHAGIIFDFKILIKTIKIIFTGDGAR